MKASTLIIVASLAANAALVAVVAIKAPSIFNLGEPEQAGATAVPAVAARTASARPGARTWAGLSSDDPRSAAAHLLAAGFPPNIARAVVRAQLDSQYNAKKRDLLALQQPRPYWSNHFNGPDWKTIAAVNSLSKQEGKELDAIFGPDSDPEPLKEADLRNRSGGLTQDKFDRVQAILSDYNDMKGEIYSAAKGFMIPDDREKMQYLEKQQQEDLASALTPAELEEYQLRNGNVASQLRYNLQAFNPSEDEFRAIFNAQQGFDQQYNSPYGASLTADQQKDRQAHQADLLAQIQAALGPDRYAEYKQDTDQNYIATVRLAERLELPANTAQLVTAVQSDITKRADAVRNDATLSPADKATQLSALADEATSKVTAVMGDHGLAAYKQSGGWWIQGLKSPTN